MSVARACSVAEYSVRMAAAGTAPTDEVDGSEAETAAIGEDQTSAKTEPTDEGEWSDAETGLTDEDEPNTTTALTGQG